MRWSRIRLGPTERRLAAALELLAGMDGFGELERERRVQLLTELATALEARDPYTHGHSRRVARHAAMIATGLGLPEWEVAKVRTAAALHDVGKINTPSAILYKPGRLTEAELGLIKLHVVDGAEM